MASLVFYYVVVVFYWREGELLGGRVVGGVDLEFSAVRGAVARQVEDEVGVGEEGVD